MYNMLHLVDEISKSKFISKFLIAPIFGARQKLEKKEKFGDEFLFLYFVP